MSARSFEEWLETASTLSLEANLRTARNSRESEAIRQELKKRGEANPDTGTRTLFAQSYWEKLGHGRTRNA